MSVNAAGLIVSGHLNPNWKGGPHTKVCVVCSKQYEAKHAQSASRFCSLQCVGVSQRGTPQKPKTSVILNCVCCAKKFEVVRARAATAKCCSRKCRLIMHGRKFEGEKNPNWSGGLSRKPYPYNFRYISRAIQERDSFKCRGINCSGVDPRLTAHHINYDKDDCRPENLITLCSSCNSKANFRRDEWMAAYQAKMVSEADQYPFDFYIIRKTKSFWTKTSVLHRVHETTQIGASNVGSTDRA